MGNNDEVTHSALQPTDDTSEVRKARGAFFTPEEIVQYITHWAVRSPTDRVLEPSAGDAAFLVAATYRLRALGLDPADAARTDGVEIHAASAAVARNRVSEAGGRPRIHEGDFFAVRPRTEYAAVIGNPPYIRYQEFQGDLRVRSRAAALRGGVVLSGLASSWAAFTVHAAQFLCEGGRLALVLPAELLSVNYAGPVRKFLFERFHNIELVLFDEQVFPEAEADVVLLLADGFNDGPSTHVVFRRARNAKSLTSVLPEHRWMPLDSSVKWVHGLVGGDPVDCLRSLVGDGHFATLDQWGDTTLGMATGNNGFFALSRARANELGLDPTDVIRLSPPGSSHLRGLVLSNQTLSHLESNGKAVYLFRPTADLSPAAKRYVAAGRAAGVHEAYKCRVRSPWFLVPLVKPADMLLTYMNADTPRLVSNRAKAHHLNSVHGVYLRDRLRRAGRDFLPIAALNTATLLHAEIVGRSYGGGILKIEPREADRWVVPSPGLITKRAAALRAVKRHVANLLRRGRLMAAVELVMRR